MNRKNILDFTVGDSKSNQQTASKVDCNITINNGKPWKAPEIELQDVESSNDLNVKDRDVKIDNQNEQRYSITTKTKPVLKEDLINSLDFKNTIIEIYKEILTKNDKELIANLLDLSGKIIVSCEQLIELISIAMNLKKTDIHLKLQDNIISSCCKVKLLPFKNIISITVGSVDLKLHQYEAYNVINEYVSLETVYSP